jgi:hypothetical protein
MAHSAAIALKTAIRFFVRITGKHGIGVGGNFNMTNVDELFQQLVDLGQHPKEKTDTVTVLERIGHFWMKKTTVFITATETK